MNLVLTHSIAVIQARIAIIEGKAHSLIDLSDMQAFRTLKRNIDKFIAAKAAALEVPNDPLGHIQKELKAAINAMRMSDQFYAECMAYSLPESGKISKTMSSLSREKDGFSQRLSEIAAKFPTDVLEHDGEIAPLVEEVRALVKMPMPNGHSIRELWQFANGKGKFYAQVQRCWATFISEYNAQIDNLISLAKVVNDGNHINARKRFKQISRRFADLDYKSVEQTISAAEQKAERVNDARLLAEASGFVRAGDLVKARQVYSQSTGGFADLDYKSVEQLISAAELKAERENNIRLLAEAAKYAQAGNHLAARRAFNKLNTKFTDLDYKSVAQQIDRWEKRLDEVEEFAAGVKACMQDSVTSVWWRPFRYYIDGRRECRLRRAKVSRLKDLMVALKDDAALYSDNEYRQEADRLANNIERHVAEWDAAIHSMARSSVLRLIIAVAGLSILLFVACGIWLQSRPSRIFVVSPHDWEIFIDGTNIQSTSSDIVQLKAGIYNVALERAGVRYQSRVDLRAGKQLLIIPENTNIVDGALDLRFVPSIINRSDFYACTKSVTLIQTGGQSTNTYFIKAVGDYIITSNLPNGSYDLAIEAPKGYGMKFESNISIEDGKTLIENVLVSNR